MNPSQPTQERIVEAAVQLFSSQGFNGTSTREIARLADVNETSLFRYFPHKQDLFWAALQSRITRLRLRKELQSGLAENKPPEIVVPLVIAFLVETSAYQPELIRLLRFSLLELRPGAERVYRQQLGPIFQQVLTYLENCIGRGAGRLEPSIVAVGLLATVLEHDRLLQLFTGSSAPYANTQEMIAAYCSFWLHVLTTSRRTEEPEPSFATNIQTKWQARAAGVSTEA